MQVKIELCMGSSCFARGNRDVLSELEKVSNKADSMEITGHLCMNNCSDGPVIKINGTEYLNNNCQEIVGIVTGLLREKS